jgi:exopolyphosphatase/guanosine-5'-triphosphate,3'-diphosphate pyrophosphatase
MTRLLATADLGSNTAHLLVAATDGETVTRAENVSEWIGLGEVVGRLGMIPNEKLNDLVAALKIFKKTAQDQKAEPLYVFATEAIRTARNHAVVLQHIRSETGISVDVITPKREAEFGYRGILLDSRATNPDIVFEIGGGSAQIARIAADKVDVDISLPIGTGKLTAESHLKHPATNENVRRIKEHITHALQGVSLQLPRDAKAVASGGVVRGLWRALHPDGEKRLFREELDYIAFSSRRLSVDQIASRFNVKLKRAQTLLPGALVYSALMEHFGLSEITVSEFGVREGAILEMARGNVEACAV